MKITISVGMVIYDKNTVIIFLQLTCAHSNVIADHI